MLDVSATLKLIHWICSTLIVAFVIGVCLVQLTYAQDDGACNLAFRPGFEGEPPACEATECLLGAAVFPHILFHLSHLSFLSSSIRAFFLARVVQAPFNLAPAGQL
jgi:hypothetical protein